LDTKIYYGFEEDKVRNKFKNIKVVVLGDHMVDHTIYCKPKRISQEAPVLITKKYKFQDFLGGASNVALNIKALGAKVYAGGVIGNDHFGNILIDLFNSNDIDISGLVKEQRPTTTKTRVIATKRQLLRFDRETEKNIEDQSEVKIVGNIKEINPDIIVIADYDKGNITKSLMQKLTKLNIPIYMNGKPNHIASYENIHALICNDYEFKNSFKYLNLETKTEETLLERLNLKVLIRTLGDQGLVVCTKDSKVKIEAYKVKCVDPTGASDTIISTFCLESQFLNTIEAAEHSNKAASIIVTKFGTKPITYEEYCKCIK
jgi:D-beta-D-heptose 7-phosphate kinase/D-beta-D-heptose 1-phosphate adenosyltransferase